MTIYNIPSILNNCLAWMVVHCVSTATKSGLNSFKKIFVKDDIDTMTTTVASATDDVVVCGGQSYLHHCFNYLN